MSGRLRPRRVAGLRVNYYGVPMLSLEALIAYIRKQVPSEALLVGGSLSPAEVGEQVYGVVAVVPPSSRWHVYEDRVPKALQPGKGVVRLVRVPWGGQKRRNFWQEAVEDLSNEVGGRDRLAGDVEHELGFDSEGDETRLVGEIPGSGGWFMFRLQAKDVAPRVSTEERLREALAREATARERLMEMEERVARAEMCTCLRQDEVVAGGVTLTAPAWSGELGLVDCSDAWHSIDWTGPLWEDEDPGFGRWSLWSFPSGSNSGGVSDDRERPPDLCPAWAGAKIGWGPDQ